MWWLAIALAAPLEDACAEALAAGPGVVHAIQWEGLRGLAEERGLAPVAESFHEQLSWVATSRKGTWTLYAERAPDAAPACGTFPLGHGLVLGGWRLHSTWERGKRGRFDPKGSERAFVALLEHLATKAVRPVDRFELPTPVRQTTTFRLAERSDLILSPTDGWALVQHNVVHGGDELPGGAMLMREVPADRGFAFESDAAGEVVVEVLPPLEPTPLEVDGQVRVRPADHDGPRGAHARLVLEVPEPTTLTLQASAVRDGPYRGMVLHPRVTLYDDTGVRTANIWYAEEDDGVEKPATTSRPGAMSRW